MSFRFLYRRIPTAKRLCNYYRCQKPVRRNIDRDKGRIYHHGCLMNAKDELFRCLECVSDFDATEANYEYKDIPVGDDVQKQVTILCPYCGSSHLRHPRFKEPIIQQRMAKEA